MNESESSREGMMKIYITGSTGSGKTSTARELSRRFSVPVYEMDELVWDNSNGYSGTRFPVEVRDSKIAEMVAMPSWIAEGIYFKPWMMPVLRSVDFVLVLTPPTYIRDYRLIKRCIQSRFQTERPKEGLVHLYKNIKWGHTFKRQEMPQLIDLLNQENIKYDLYAGNNAAEYVSKRVV